MARRASRAHRGLSIVERIDAVRHSMPPTDDGPSIATVIEQRHRVQADRDRVASWFVAAGDPESPAAVVVCCPRHALRRAYEWVKDDDAIELDDIEQRHHCAPQAAS